jgi:streptogramin lyase
VLATGVRELADISGGNPALWIAPRLKHSDNLEGRKMIRRWKLRACLRTAAISANLLWLAAAAMGQTTLYTFTTMPGQARDIAVGPNGALWVIGAGVVSGTGYNIFRWAGTQWVKVDGSGTKIAVDPSGNAWVTNSAGKIYRYSFVGTPPWTQMTMLPQDPAAKCMYSMPGA